MDVRSCARRTLAGFNEGSLAAEFNGVRLGGAGEEEPLRGRRRGREFPTTVPIVAPIGRLLDRKFSFFVIF